MVVHWQLPAVPDRPTSPGIPTVFVSGGPMEAGKVRLGDADVKVDLIAAMVIAGRPSASEGDFERVERSACPTCGSCSAMFTANSMNCLVEALGLALPGNGTMLATDVDRQCLFREAGRVVVDMTRRHYEKDDRSVLLRSIANRRAFINAMALDIAMGGSTNTVLHILAAAREGEVDFAMADVEELSRRVPHLCKIAPATNDSGPSARLSARPGALGRPRVAGGGRRGSDRARP